MRVQPVDPRDIQWRDERPVYRVYFWSQATAPPEIDQVMVVWQSDEFEIRDAQDVHEVVAWARTHNHHERYTLYVVVECDGQPGLVRLAGVDPTSGSQSDL